MRLGHAQLGANAIETHFLVGSGETQRMGNRQRPAVVADLDMPGMDGERFVAAIAPAAVQKFFPGIIKVIFQELS